MRNILIVGVCFQDAQRLYTSLKSLFETEVKWIKTIEETKEHLKLGPIPDLIMANKICDEDKKLGLELLNYTKENNLNIPTIIFTGFEKDQKKAVEQGAIASFDLELLIGYLGPARQEQKKQAVASLNKILSN